jgi:hypothetical protein
MRRAESLQDIFFFVPKFWVKAWAEAAGPGISKFISQKSFELP